MRRLQVTKAGYWYVLLTIAMGVVALVTANNVLYLMESLLLGGMILSGVVSERAIASVEVEVVRRQATANKPTRDECIVKNPTRFSFFCLELGEWKDGELKSFAFVTKIGPNSEIIVPAPQLFEKRGTYRWEGLGIATAAPFGFARKILVIKQPGTRIIWPEKKRAQGRDLRESRLAGSGVADAEVRTFSLDEDIRHIVWKLSAKGLDPVARKSRIENPQIRLTLKLAQPSRDQFETEISSIASAIYDSAPLLTSDVRLRVLGQSQKKTWVGRTAALNYLATAEMEGRP